MNFLKIYRGNSKIIGFLCFILKKLCIFAACIERYHKSYLLKFS